MMLLGVIGDESVFVIAKIDDEAIFAFIANDIAVAPRLAFISVIDFDHNATNKEK